MSKKKRIWVRILIALLCLGLLGGITVLSINGHVKKSTAEQILSPEDAAALTDVDCILVLGCYVHDSGRPSDMLGIGSAEALNCTSPVRLRSCS